MSRILGYTSDSIRIKIFALVVWSSRYQRQLKKMASMRISRLLWSWKLKMSRIDEHKRSKAVIFTAWSVCMTIETRHSLPFSKYIGPFLAGLWVGSVMFRYYCTIVFRLNRGQPKRIQYTQNIHASPSFYYISQYYHTTNTDPHSGTHTNTDIRHKYTVHVHIKP